MANCINVNSVLYRELKRLSTLPEILLKAEIARYLNNHEGRFPKSDEIPGTNSIEAIKQDLKITEDGTSKIEDILNFTGTSDLNMANIVINDKYRDIDTEIIPINKTALVDIKERPSVFKYRKSFDNDFTHTDSKVFILESLDKMAKTMGINIKYMTTKTMKKEGILDKIPDALLALAFIYLGDIYVNTDVASIDSKTHELMHILLGAMRFKEPDLYFELVLSMKEVTNLESFTTRYPNRTESDLLEEIFVDLFSKYISGIDNAISNFNDDVLYQISYNITRMLDSILMGDNSVASLEDEILFNSSLKEVAAKVNSSTMPNTRLGFLEDALIHRTLSNVKLELLENGDLIELC